jgi:predicted enzyme related to lactoylglutathione lyase
MDPVVHFEMPAEDRERMKKFYETAFGWKTKQMGEDMGNYVVVMTSDSEMKPGSINGGFYQKTEDLISQYPSIVIAVKDIGESIKKVQAAGGKVLLGHEGKDYDDIPGVGLYASFLDTEGNRVGMLQPKRGM